MTAQTTTTYRCQHCGWVGLIDRIPEPCQTWHLTLIVESFTGLFLMGD